MQSSISKIYIILTCKLVFFHKFSVLENSREAVVHLQIWLYESWDSLFPISMIPTANLWVQNTIFNDKSAILLHPGTRWNKNFASQRHNYAQKMQGAQVTKSLGKSFRSPWKVLEFYTNSPVWTFLVKHFIFYTTASLNVCSIDTTVFALINMGLEATNPVEQKWRRPACASMQSDQRLCYSLIGKYHN